MAWKKHHWRIGTLLVGLALIPVGAAAQEAVPDFSSDFVSWIGIGNELETPSSGPGPVTSDPQYPYVSNAEAARTGQPANFRVADLTNPILQPWVIDSLRAQNEEALSGNPVFDGKTRCWPPGVPAFLLNPVLPVLFLQDREQVTMILEDNFNVRRVDINRAHPENVSPSWHGHSVGHYEGDSLVVDTVGFNDRTMLDNYRTPHTDKLHIVERIRMMNNGNQLEISIYVEDPAAFTMPWSAVRRFRRVPDRELFEVVCAENNEQYFGFNVLPIPEDDTPDF
jgi:hypothetical protein